MTARLAIVLRAHLPPVRADDPRVAELAGQLRALSGHLGRLSVAVSPTAAECLAISAPDVVTDLRSAGELLTTPATDALLPLMDHDRIAMGAQLRVAVETHLRHFGSPPTGVRLPDGGYEPRTDDLLVDAGLRYAVVDAEAVRCASSAPVYGLFAPLACPGSGLAILARDPESRRYEHPAVERPLYPDADAEAAWGVAHAEAFLAARRLQVEWLAKRMDRAPLLLCELDAATVSADFVRGLIPRVETEAGLCLDTPANALAAQPVLQAAWPGPSITGGMVAASCQPTHGWLLRHLHAAARRMRDLATDPSKANRQAARELLMAQAGAWLEGLAQAEPESLARVQDHLEAFTRIATAQDEVDPEWLETRRARWPHFPDVDPGLFIRVETPRKPRPPPGNSRKALPRPDEVW